MKRVPCENQSVDNLKSVNDNFSFHLGDRKTASIHVIIQFAPKILKMEKSVFRSGSGLALEISCSTAGEPETKVTWYKGDEVIMQN